MSEQALQKRVDDLEARVAVLEEAARAKAERKGWSAMSLRVLFSQTLTFSPLFMFVWSLLYKLLSRTALQFVVFVYFTKVHRWLVQMSYRYYVLLLLRYLE